MHTPCIYIDPTPILFPIIKHTSSVGTNRTFAARVSVCKHVGDLIHSNFFIMASLMFYRENEVNSPQEVQYRKPCSTIMSILSHNVNVQLHLNVSYISRYSYQYPGFCGQDVEIWWILHTKIVITQIKKHQHNWDIRFSVWIHRYFRALFLNARFSQQLDAASFRKYKKSKCEHIEAQTIRYSPIDCYHHFQ